MTDNAAPAKTATSTVTITVSAVGAPLAANASAVPTSGQIPLTVAFSGTASGFLAPRLDTEQVRSAIAGKSRGQALDYLHTLPVRSVDIRQQPLQLPFLPLVGSRIQVQIEVEGAAAHG